MMSNIFFKNNYFSDKLSHTNSDKINHFLKKEIEFSQSSSRFLRPSTRYAIYDAKHTLLVYLLLFKSKRSRMFDQ